MLTGKKGRRTINGEVDAGHTAAKLNGALRQSICQDLDHVISDNAPDFVRAVMAITHCNGLDYLTSVPHGDIPGVPQDVNGV